MKWGREIEQEGDAKGNDWEESIYFILSFIIFYFIYF